MKKKIFLSIVSLLFVLIGAGCNKSRTTVYKGGQHDLNHLYNIASVSGSSVSLNDIGYEASTISADVVPPIKNVFISFGRNHIIITIEDSNSENAKELRMLFRSVSSSCDVYGDDYGKVGIKKDGKRSYSVLFNDQRDNWYLLGKFAQDPPLDCDLQT